MKRRTEQNRIKHAHKLAKSQMTKPKGKSKYARKRAYCHFNKVWGFEVPEPKPWK